MTKRKLEDDKRSFDLTVIKEINSAADFYGYRVLILEAIEDDEFKHELEQCKSVYDFFFSYKEKIIEKLGI